MTETTVPQTIEDRLNELNKSLAALNRQVQTARRHIAKEETEIAADKANAAAVIEEIARLMRQSAGIEPGQAMPPPNPISNG